MTRFALYKYPLSLNLGDDIQSIAARMFLPKVDYLMDRDSFDVHKAPPGTRLIANGWYKHRPNLWPPTNPNITPLYISIHIRESCKPYFSSPESIEYLKCHAPIGCRDYPTLKFLTECGVEAYFSGCLTLTLEMPEAPVSDEILLVDAPTEIRSLVPDKLRSTIGTASNMLPSTYLAVISTKKIKRLRLDPFHRFFMRKAYGLLARFSRAKLVITSRLHCAMPCVALGVPVYFIPPNPVDPRLEGLKQYTHFRTLSDLKSGAATVEWETPPRNPDDAAPLQKLLRDRCIEFVERGRIN